MATSVGDTELGCGQYDVFFMTRCGGNYVCKADGVTDIAFTRKLNDTSTAEITVAIGDVSNGCCECLASINPWQHEIIIFRNGVSVWAGPIVDIEFDLSSETAKFRARDLSAWLDRRVIELTEDNEYDVEDVDAKDAFEFLINHAYCKQAWCMTWSSSATGVPVTRYYPGYSTGDRWGGSYQNVGAEIRALAREGIDFTVVNRHMYGGNLETNPPSASGAVLLATHWMNLPSIKVSGVSMSTRTIVAGGDGGWDGYYDEQIWIEPPISGPISPATLTGNQLTYGLIETFTTEQHLYDEDTTINPNAITQNAFGRHELNSVPFVHIDGGQLAPSAPLGMENLIPGSIIEVRMNNSCRSFTGPYRLYSVSVSLINAKESVNIQLAPVGVDTVRSLG